MDIVAKLWGFCHALRHDGIDYGDYIEQLTYLLFLKMIEEKGAGQYLFYPAHPYPNHRTLYEA